MYTSLDLGPWWIHVSAGQILGGRGEQIATPSPLEVRPWG